MFRIPLSLSWLIKKRAKILWEINAARKVLDEYILEEEKKIQVLEDDLKNLDGVFRLHEIQIDPNLVKAKRTNKPGKYLPHGGYTKLILDSLKQVYPSALSINDLTHLLLGAIGQPETDFKEIRGIVANRVRALTLKGALVSIHERYMGVNVVGYWKLNPDGIPNPKKLVNGELASSFVPLPITPPPD